MLLEEVPLRLVVDHGRHDDVPRRHQGGLVDASDDDLLERVPLVEGVDDRGRCAVLRPRFLLADASRCAAATSRRATPATISAATRATRRRPGRRRGVRPPLRRGPQMSAAASRAPDDDGDAGDELTRLQADGIADAGDDAEVDREVDGLGPGGGRLERLLRDRLHAVAQHVLERVRAGAEVVEYAAGGRVRRSRPPADEHQIGRRDDAELQRPRPARRRGVQRARGRSRRRREGDDAEPPAELAAEYLHHRHAHERVAAEDQRRGARRHDVGQALMRLHEGHGDVVGGELDVAVVRGPEPAPERRQPVRVGLRRARTAAGPSAAPLSGSPSTASAMPASAAGSSTTCRPRRPEPAGRRSRARRRPPRAS